MLDMGILNIAPEPEAEKQVKEIPLPDIGFEGQPRTEFDMDLVNTLARQFKDPKVGQIENVIVRVNPIGNPPYIMIHGETRYKAATVADMPTIRGEIRSEAGFVRQLLSNETRGDLSVMDKAQAYKHLIEHYGYTQGEVADLLGTDTGTVSRYLSMIELPEVVMAAYKGGKATALRVLCDLRKLCDKHPKRHGVISKFIDDNTSVTSEMISVIDKQLSKKKPSTKKTPAMIDGKQFKVASVEDGIMTIQKTGEKVVEQYRLTRIP